MRNMVRGVPFAVLVSLALVVVGSIVATSPATRGSWIGTAVPAACLFAAILCTGTAVTRDRRER